MGGRTNIELVNTYPCPLPTVLYQQKNRNQVVQNSSSIAALFLLKIMKIILIQ